MSMSGGDDTDRGVRALRVAGVQLASRLGRIHENLAQATGYAEEAAANGVELLLFHELMPGGYAWDESAWCGAEPSDGATASWLRETAGRLHLWIGTSFLEASGEDFWNTFALVAPDGTEAGRVRKEFPSMYEARVFRGRHGSHVIDTALGRIGVAICFDAHTAAVACALVEADVDLLLAPHCYCVPSHPSRAVSAADIERLVRNVAGIAPLYARTLGIPALVTNRVGAWDTPKGAGYTFAGQATIADSDGTVVAHLDDRAGMVSALIHLDPARKTHAAPRAYSRWIYPGPPGREALRLIEWWEGRRYRGAGERRREAVRLASRAEAARP